MTITVHSTHEEPTLGHVELKKAAVNWGGNAQETDADADARLGLNWGRGGGPLAPSNAERKE